MAILWTIGILSLLHQTKPLGWGQATLCIIWLGAYSMTVGPIVYTVVAEVGSTRLRTQTLVLARSTYYIGNIICGGILQPRLISPGAWNAKGKTVGHHETADNRFILTLSKAFFWAGLATLTLIWGYFRLFETKDRTYGEMDYMVSK